MKTIYLLTVAACAFCMITSCSSDEDKSNSDNIKAVRKERILTIKQSEPDANHVQTRTILKDQGDEGIYASWEMGDKATIYNKSYPAAGYMFVKASSSSKNTNFTGSVDCQAGDVIRMFYPEVNVVSSVTDENNSGILTLDISKQKGTLEDIQLNYDFCYGEATVSDVTETTATADMGSSENLMAICKFTFKSGNEYLKNINKVNITGVHEKGVFTLSNSNPELIRCQFADFYNSVKQRNVKSKAPEFSELEQSQGIITVDAGNVDNFVYVALYPGSTTPAFEVTTDEGKYEGTLTASNLQAGKYYNVVVNLTRTGDASNAEYVEVCGIKWAKGNLQYDPINGGDEGFMENWRIAPTQWHYVGYDKTNNFNPYEEEIKDNFSLGQLGENAYSNKMVSLPGVYAAGMEDISGKLYYPSVADYNETNLFDKATFGDLAYWASKGKYRIPRNSDMQILCDYASWQLGYIKVNNRNINGVLFYNPGNERITNNKSRLLTDEEMETGLFIPSAGRLYSTYYTNNTKTVTTLNYNNERGYYMSSVININAYSQNSTFNCLFFTTDLSITSEKPYPANNQFYQYKIRPVLCE